MTYDLYQLSKTRGKDGTLKLGSSDETRRHLAKKSSGNRKRTVEDIFIESLVAAGQLLEWAVVHGQNTYGTLKSTVDQAIAEGRPVLLEIDLQGARQVRQAVPDAQFVFLAPPSWDELVRRLVGRGTESAEEQQRRLETGKVELAAEPEFDHTVVNDDVRRAADELVSLMGLTPHPR